MRAILGAMGIGGALAYLFDPDAGRRRRAALRERVEAVRRDPRHALDEVRERATEIADDIRTRVRATTDDLSARRDVRGGGIADRLRDMTPSARVAAAGAGTLLALATVRRAGVVGALVNLAGLAYLLRHATSGGSPAPSSSVPAPPLAPLPGTAS